MGPPGKGLSEMLLTPLCSHPAVQNFTQRVVGCLSDYIHPSLILLPKTGGHGVEESLSRWMNTLCSNASLNQPCYQAIQRGSGIKLFHWHFSTIQLNEALCSINMH